MTNYNHDFANPNAGRIVKQASDAQTLTMSGLDGNAAGTYYIEGFIHIPINSGGTILSWQPNGLTTAQEGGANTGVGAYSDAAILTFTGSINIADAPVSVRLRSWWELQTSVGGVAAWRGHRTIAEVYFSTGTSDFLVYDGAGSWQETATNLSSLVLHASTGAHIAAGSQLRWWPTSRKWDA